MMSSEHSITLIMQLSNKPKAKKNRIKGAILMSGRGSNMKSLLSASLLNLIPVSFDLVITDRDTPALEYVRNNYGNKNIKFLKLNLKSMSVNRSYSSDIKENINLNSLENELHNQLTKYNIQIICLAGFMKILSANFVDKWKNRILNIHPSLLPAYKGLNTHKRVLENNEKWHGCSVHVVTKQLDSGAIICQKKIPVLKNESEASLASRVLQEEHSLYIKAVKKYLASNIYNL